ncbi:MAG: tRNA (adenosine(37)-N6)-threonylcarbamoyltransferase complex dimerization subunit type 1 TsaB, partial [Acidimicrobiales bacterium]
SPTVSSPGELASELLASGDDCLVVGDGAIEYCEQLTEVQGVEIAERALQYPSAQSLVALAHARAIREDFVSPHQIVPVYLREPDAVPNWSVE